MALYEHGWGRRLATGALLALFRYEVLRLPDDGLLIALWTEGPGGLLLKCAGLLCMPDGSRHRFGNYECEILEHDLCENRAGRLCRSPRRWLGRLTGRRGTIRWEAERRGQVCPVIGDGFMAGLDYVIERGDVLCESAEGAGYAEQFGVAWGDQE